MIVLYSDMYRDTMFSTSKEQIRARGRTIDFNVNRESLQGWLHP